MIISGAYFEDLILSADTKQLTLTAMTQINATKVPLKITVYEDGKIITKAVGAANEPIVIPIPSPHLWTPEDPYLYNVSVSSSTGGQFPLGEEVTSYFGMRTVSLSMTAAGKKTLQLNGNPFFASGWLDQSWWPDGQYTAPTDEALAFDVYAVKTFGFNMVRLHQKINPARWYYHADKVLLRLLFLLLLWSSHCSES